MWDLTVSVPCHCLSFYFTSRRHIYADVKCALAKYTLFFSSSLLELVEIRLQTDEKINIFNKYKEEYGIP